MSCEHMNFHANVSVGRLSKEDGGPVTSFTAGITVKCAECGLAFRFTGVASGNHFFEPRVSIDGTELRAPLEPAEHQRFAARASYIMPPRSDN